VRVAGLNQSPLLKAKHVCKNTNLFPPFFSVLSLITGAVGWSDGRVAKSFCGERNIGLAATFEQVACIRKGSFVRRTVSCRSSYGMLDHWPIKDSLSLAWYHKGSANRREQHDQHEARIKLRSVRWHGESFHGERYHSGSNGARPSSSPIARSTAAQAKRLATTPSGP